MEQENKEFPNQIEQSPHEISTPETPVLETEEGVIVEQPMTEEEKQEITEQLALEQVQPVAPTVQEVKAVAMERAAVEQEQLDKAHEHLQKDNEIETSADAHSILNDLMNN